MLRKTLPLILTDSPFSPGEPPYPRSPLAPWCHAKNQEERERFIRRGQFNRTVKGSKRRWVRPLPCLAEDTWARVKRFPRNARLGRCSELRPSGLNVQIVKKNVVSLPPPIKIEKETQPNVNVGS